MLVQNPVFLMISFTQGRYLGSANVYDLDVVVTQERWFAYLPIVSR
jgi:hypothetical protein